MSDDVKRMRTVSMRELHQQTSALIRQVHEHGVEIHITQRGEVVARIVPAVPSDENAWASLDQLAQEIGHHWPHDVSAVQALSEARR